MEDGPPWTRLLRTRVAVKDLTPSSSIGASALCGAPRVGSPRKHGISLLLALISLAVLSTVGGGVAVYTSSNLRHSYTDRSSASAYHLAEAGLAEALARLQGATTRPSRRSCPDGAQRRISRGKYTYSGTAVSTTDRVT